MPRLGRIAAERPKKRPFWRKPSEAGRRKGKHNFVEMFASHLLKLTTAELAGLPGGIAANQDAIAEGWQEATKSTSAKPVLQGGSKIREPFMAHNINTKLTKPGLVQIGEEHVTNLDGKITDGKYHKSYDKFVEDTKA